MTTTPKDLEQIRARHEQANLDIKHNFGAAYSSRITQDSYGIHADRAALLSLLEPAPSKATAVGREDRKEIERLVESIRPASAGGGYSSKSVGEAVDGIVAILSRLGQSGEAAVTDAARDVLAERQRQVSAEGWTRKHDDYEHRAGELARAAAVYAAGPGLFKITLNVPQQVWPYQWEYKPKDPRRDLVRAGALILAEIERLDRAKKPQAEA